MPGHHEYRCTECGDITDPLLLFARTVTFIRIADKQKRSRTSKWLCSECLEKDPDWNFPRNSGPGSKSASQRRIEERKRNE